MPIELEFENGTLTIPVGPASLFRADGRSPEKLVLLLDDSMVILEGRPEDLKRLAHQAVRAVETMQPGVPWWDNCPDDFRPGGTD